MIVRHTGHLRSRAATLTDSMTRQGSRTHEWPANDKLMTWNGHWNDMVIVMSGPFQDFVITYGLERSILMTWIQASAKIAAGNAAAIAASIKERMGLA